MYALAGHESAGCYIHRESEPGECGAACGFVRFSGVFGSMSTSQIFTSIAIAAFFGFFGMLLAWSKGRNRLLGFALGMTGVIGWIVLALLPSRREPGPGPR